MLKAVRIFLALISVVYFTACGKTGGEAPSLTLVSANLVSFTVSPTNTFVPKGQNIHKLAPLNEYQAGAGEGLSIKKQL